VATPAPQGQPPAFDRDDLQAVVAHMCAWEAVETECDKALKALVSLAYSSTAKVVAHGTALLQVLRLMQLHASSSLVQLHGVQAICNMADDEAAALGYLSDPAVLTALVLAIAGQKAAGASAKATDKATEAIARIVAASDTDSTGQLAKVFSAVIASGSHEASAPEITKICDQLVKNEVTDAKKIAEACMAASASARQSTLQAVGWLELARCLAGDKMIVSELQIALVEKGAITMSVALMKNFVRDVDVQMLGIETLSSLIGIYMPGLEAFAKAGGVSQIEAALREHLDNLRI
jgi:hypothetical protein